MTFDVGYSLDIGAVDVQNRVSQVQGQIPQIVNEAGIIIDKTSTDMVLVVSLTSPGGTYDDVWLGNYGDIYLNDPLLRVPGPLPHPQSRCFLRPVHPLIPEPVRHRGRPCRGV